MIIQTLIMLLENIVFLIIIKLNMLDSSEYWARECMVMKPLCYHPVRMLYRKHTDLKRV